MRRPHPHPSSGGREPGPDKARPGRAEVWASTEPTPRPEWCTQPSTKCPGLQRRVPWRPGPQGRQSLLMAASSSQSGATPAHLLEGSPVTELSFTCLKYTAKVVCRLPLEGEGCCQPALPCPRLLRPPRGPPPRPQHALPAPSWPVNLGLGTRNLSRDISVTQAAVLLEACRPAP